MGICKQTLGEDGTFSMNVYNYWAIFDQLAEQRKSKAFYTFAIPLAASVASGMRILPGRANDLGRTPDLVPHHPAQRASNPRAQCL